MLFFLCQAPSNMKAVLQAGWLLTTAVGNFIVLIVAQLAKLDKQVRTTTAYDLICLITPIQSTY